jgi:hypothetical protein
MRSLRSLRLRTVYEIRRILNFNKKLEKNFIKPYKVGLE